MRKLAKEDWSVEELEFPTIGFWQGQYRKIPQRFAILQISTWTRDFLFRTYSPSLDTIFHSPQDYSFHVMSQNTDSFLSLPLHPSQQVNVT